MDKSDPREVPRLTSGDILVPFYQPGDTKLLRVTLTEEQWWALSRVMADADDDETLEQFVNRIVRDKADKLVGSRHS